MGGFLCMAEPLAIGAELRDLCAVGLVASLIGG
jgi:hypothetical protein